MTFLKNIIILVLVIIIGYKYEPEWKNIREKYNLYEIDMSNIVNITSIIDLTSMIDLKTFLNNKNKMDMNESYSKEILLSITKEKEIEIINIIALIITKNIINEANNGHRIYYWEDKQYYLNKNVLEMLLIKLSDKLPNVKITNEYSRSLRLIFDWN